MGDKKITDVVRTWKRWQRPDIGKSERDENLPSLYKIYIEAVIPPVRYGLLSFLYHCWGSVLSEI